MPSENEVEAARLAIEAQMSPDGLRGWKNAGTAQVIGQVVLEAVEKARAQQLTKQAEREAELEKLLLMIAERGALDFDEEGWALYDKIIKPLIARKALDKEES